MSNEPPIPPKAPRKRRRLLRFLTLLVIAFAGFLVWLNGPGVRWLLPKVAGHFLQKQGMFASFEARGSLLGGLSLHRIDFFGGPVVMLRIEELRPGYYWRELIKGRVRGIQIHDLVVEVDLDRKFPVATTPQGPQDPQQPFDIARLVEMIRSQRGKLSGYDVDITIKKIHVHRSSQAVMELGACALRHQRDTSTWGLSLGEIEMAGGRKFPAQVNVIDWREDAITLDFLDLSADLGISELILTTPGDLQPSLRANLKLLDSRFVVTTSPGLHSASLQLQEGAVDFSRLGGLLGKELPLQGRLDECAIEITPHNLPIHGKAEPAPRVDGAVSLRLKDLVYQDQMIEECVIQLQKNAENADLSIQLKALGAEQSITSQVAWDSDPTTVDELQNLTARYDLKAPRLKPMLLALRPLLKIASDPLAPLPPEAALIAKGSCRMQGGTIGPIELDLNLTAADPAVTPIVIKARMANLEAAEAELTITGLAAKGSYNLEEKAYQGSADLVEFLPQSLSAWLDWTGVKIPADIKTSLTWQGGGVLSEGIHQGQTSIQSLLWQSEGSADIVATGKAAYEWPQSFDLTDLNVQAGAQQVNLDARFAGQSLYVSRLTLLEAGKVLINGKALIPIPDNMATTDDFFSQHKTLDVSLQSVELPLDTFNNWLPKDKPLPISGRTKLELQITGTPAAPVVNGDLFVKDVRSLAQANLPPVDLLLNLVTVGRDLQVSGQLLTKRTAPVTVNARMPLRPEQWAKDPGLVQQETISADINIPRFELSRFKDLLPQVKDVGGVVEGKISVKGSIAAPDIRGRFDLTKLLLVLPNDKIPPIRDGNLRLSFVDRAVKLELLDLRLAGGDLKASGMMRMPAQGERSLDFTIRGTALPLWRDAAVIARANTDIRVAGPWSKAQVSGSVRMVDSLLYKDFELIPIGKPFTLPQAAALPPLDTKIAAKATSLPEPFRNWGIDVTFKTDDPFLIRGNLARGSVTADARVTGTLGDPQPLGKAIINDLTASLPLSRLRVSSGNISLTPASGLDPVLDIRGSSRVSNYEVNLYIYGAVSAPKMLLTSEPPLPENEIMTLLATGTTTEALSDGATAQSKGTQFLIEEFRRGRLPLGKRLLPLLSMIENVELTVGEPDPYSGKKRASAKLPVTRRYSLYGAVDGEGKTRGLLMFEMKFR